MLPKSERLCKVKANNGMLLLPAEHCAPGFLEECHGVIAMTVLSARGFSVGCRCGYYPPPSCWEKEWLSAARYCQSATQGWTFLLLLAHRWLSDKLGVNN